MYLEIVNHLWQSTLFVLFIGALCQLLQKDGAHIRYGLWWIASVKFLVPFSALTAIGIWLAEKASMTMVPEAWTNTVSVVARPFDASALSWSPGAIFLSIWAAGTIVVLLYWSLRAARLRSVLNTAKQESSLIDNERRIVIYRADAQIEPGVVGILRTALLLPEGLEAHLSPEQLEAVLAHELCHIRRRDNLTAAIHMIVEAAFWFHPMIWWIGAKLINERERACDEMVVALGHDRKTYAESILDVCEQYAASPLHCAAGISGSDLKRRITQIMRYQGMTSLRTTKKLLLGTLAALALAIPVVAGLAIQEIAVAQDTQQPPVSVASPSDVEEYLPIVKVAPIYPPRAAARGLEGYVVLSYTVNETGSVENARVVESTAALFESAALEAARRWKYQPRVDNGQPMAVQGVTTKIVFALEGGNIDENQE
jgi:TonB family protein